MLTGQRWTKDLEVRQQIIDDMQRDGPSESEAVTSGKDLR
jgi:hypothetical protein